MPKSGEARGQSGHQATTQRLLKAAAAEFAERGYDGAVISNIARRAGLTTGAIFSRWATKDHIMVAAVDHILEQIQPSKRLEELGIADRSPTEIIDVWAAALLTSDHTQSALKHMFASAHAHPSIGERLQAFLDEQADQLGALIERSKAEGRCDPELSTTALTLMIQAIAVGTELLISAGRTDRLVPSEHEWSQVIGAMTGAARIR